MYESFTDICREVFQKANHEAMLTRSRFISSGHVLVALADAGSDPMAELLRSFGAEPEKIRAAVGCLLKTEKRDQLETPHLKQVVGYMLEAAKRLSHEHVGTEHLLYGLLHDHKEIAIRALEAMGVDIDGLEAEVSRRLPPGSPEAIAHKKAIEERFATHPEVLKLMQHISHFRQMLENAVREKEFGKAAGYRDERVTAEKELKRLYDRLDQGH
jgi:ATP-dependent Clp protease ATP-binding subunit ClpC